MLLQFHILYLFNMMRYLYTAQVYPLDDSQGMWSLSVLCTAFGTLGTIFMKLVEVFLA
jgi:hypothetical protein